MLGCKMIVGRAGVIGLCAGAVFAWSSAQAAQVTAQWLAPVSGNWVDPTKWSGGNFPNNGNPSGTTYHAVIGAAGGPYTVTLDQSVTLDRLTVDAAGATLAIYGGSVSLQQPSVVQAGILRLSGGQIVGSGDLTIHDRMEWSGGVIGESVGRLIIGASGHLSVIGENTVALRREGENHGHMTIVGPQFKVTRDFFNHGTMIADGPSHFSSDGWVVAIKNQGLFIKQGSGTTDTGGVFLENHGEVRVDDGELKLGPRLGVAHTGHFEVMAGATLQFWGSHTLDQTSSITGEGSVLFQAGRSQHYGTIDLDGVLQVLNRSEFYGDVSVNELQVATSGATFHGSLQAPRVVLESAGPMTFAGELAMESFEWLGGSLLGGSTARIVAGGTGSFGDGIWSQQGDVKVDLVNEGEFTWRRGWIVLNEGSVQNLGTMTFDLGAGQAFSMYGQGASGELVNNGVLVHSGAGTTSLASELDRFVNAGLLHVAAGRFEVDCVLEQWGTTRVDADATLSLGSSATLSDGASMQIDGLAEFRGGAHDLRPDRWSISGAIRVNGGEVTLHAPPVAALELLSGTVNYGYFLDLGTNFSSPVMQNFNAGYTVAPGSHLSMTNALGGVGFGASDLAFATGSILGRLGGTGDISFSESLEWLGGSMTGGLDVRTVVGPGGELSLGPSSKTLSRTLEVHGDTAGVNGSMTFSNGAFISHGRFTMAAGNLLGLGGGGRFVNLDEVIVDANGVIEVRGLGNATMQFENHGLVEILRGALDIRSTLLNNGQIVVREGATLSLGGVVEHGAGASIIGAGMAEFNGGTHLLEKGVFGVTGDLRTLNGTVDVAVALGTPTWTFNGGQTNFHVDTVLESATIGGSSVGGKVGGEASLSLGSLLWTAGTILPGGEATIRTGGLLTLSGPTFGLQRTLSRRLVNHGDTSVQGSSLTIDGGELESLGEFRGTGGFALTGAGLGGAFINRGRFTTQGVGIFGLDGLLTVENAGSMQIASGTTLRISGGLHSTGSIEGAGTLRFAGGSSVIGSGAAVTVARIEIAGGHALFAGPTPMAIWSFTSGGARFLSAFDSGAMLTNTGASLRFEGGLSIAPGGVINNSGLGIVDLAGYDLSIARLQLQGGKIVDGGDLSIAEQMQWTGGSIEGAGRIIVEAGAHATLGFFAPLTLAQDLLLRGTAGWGVAALRFSDGVLRNEGLLTATASQGNTASMVGLAGGGILRNEGTIIKQGAGELRLFSNGGTMSFENTGLLDVREGKLRLEGEAVTTNAGTYAMAHAGSVSVTGGFVNASGATLAFEVGGMKERGLSGLMTITGEATLAGTLAVTTPEAFEATWGDRWVVMTYGSSQGDFDVLDLPLGGFASRSEFFGASDLRWYAERSETEYAVGVSHIADIDHDGLIGFSDLNVIVSNFNAPGSWSQGDVDGDGFVGFGDLNLVVSLFNVAAARSVPGPGGAALAALALLGAGRRRR